MSYNLENLLSHPPISAVKGDYQSEHEDPRVYGDPQEGQWSPHQALKGGKSPGSPSVPPRPEAPEVGQTNVHHLTLASESKHACRLFF